MECKMPRLRHRSLVRQPIHHLHEPIDVFSEWLDDCEAAERGEVAAQPARPRGREDMSRAVHDTSQDYDDDDDEEDLPPPSGLGQKKRATGGGGKNDKAVTNAELGLDESDSD